MKLSTQQKIEKLEAAIASDATPESIKSSMRDTLEELKKPPPPPPAPPPPPKPKENKNFVFKGLLPHQIFCEENDIEEAALPVNIRKKINATRMPIGKGDVKTAEKWSEAIIPLLQAHVKPKIVLPSPLPPRETTVEALEAEVEKYKERKAKRKLLNS